MAAKAVCVIKGDVTGTITFEQAVSKINFIFTSIY